MTRRHKILGLIGTATVIGVAGLGWIALGPDAVDFAGGRTVPLADYRGPSPAGLPPDFPSRDPVAQGKYLTQAADCQSCHTAIGGAPFAGSRAFKLPFGTIYSPNITPDKKTGIGGWTDAQFLRALRDGVGPRAHLYPVMPFASFTYLSDADALAIRAYLSSLPAVERQRPPANFSFPFNERRLMWIWGALFNKDRRFEPNIDRSPAWNRGAYLAEGLGHCGDCHTPRNLLQAPDNRRKFSGAPVDGWRALNITGDRATGIGGWSDAELAGYLSGQPVPGRPTAAGPMGEVVDRSLRHLTRSDLSALVTYLRSVPRRSTPAEPMRRRTPVSQPHRP